MCFTIGISITFGFKCYLKASLNIKNNLKMKLLTFLDIFCIYLEIYWLKLKTDFTIEISVKLSVRMI